MFTTRTILASSSTLPKEPQVPEGLRQIADRPMLRLDYSASETAAWREGGWLPFQGAKFTSTRDVSFSHEFSNRVNHKWHPLEGALRVGVTYAASTFDDAVIAARKVLENMNYGDGVKRSLLSGMAVLQAGKGAYYMTPIPDTFGALDRVEYTNGTPAVPALNLRSNGVWSVPKSNDPSAVSVHPRSNDEPIKDSRVQCRTNKIVGAIRYTSALQAVIGGDGPELDLREVPVVAH